MVLRLCSIIALCFFVFSCKGPDTVDAIYHGGTIITMESDAPVEAVAIKDGLVSAVGSYADLQKLTDASTSVVDLDGKTMLPGFIDAHSHFMMALMMARWAVLSPPPVGDINSIDALVDRLQSHKEQNNIREGEWILGWGYDQDQFAEQRHPTRYDLDERFPDNPVLILHISGHMGVGNSKALEMMSISAETPDPEGGVIVRLPNSSVPTGLLQESMVHVARQFLPKQDPADTEILIQEVQGFYASQGITTAQDGLSLVSQFEVLENAADQSKLKIDIEVLGGFQDAELWLSKYKNRFGKSNNGLRLAGLKIVSDGSPQGKTAFFTKPYQTEVPGCAHSCTGVPVINQEQLDQLVASTYSNGIQTYVHCNGDGSIDMLLNAHEKAKSLWKGEDDPRTVVIHSQFVREDQLDKYVDYGFVPSFFTNHAFYWGDVHVRNLGEQRANFLSPLKTAKAKGITATNHTDYIVTPLSQLFLMWTAVNRTSRSGQVIGPDERISAYEALKAVTINAAYQHKVEHLKGSVKVGKMADFVILDRNPLDVNPNEIKDIKVLETIKEGTIIYLAK